MRGLSLLTLDVLTLVLAAQAGPAADGGPLVAALLVAMRVVAFGALALLPLLDLAAIVSRRRRIALTAWHGVVGLVGLSAVLLVTAHFGFAAAAASCFIASRLLRR